MILDDKPFITLLGSLHSLQTGEPKAKRGILMALSDTINSPTFKEFDEIPFLSAAEMRRELENSEVPMGYYSCQTSAKTGQRQYILVYLIDEVQHMYLKFMLNSMDLGVERFVMAIVDVMGDTSLHHEYDDYSVPVIDYLRGVGIVLQENKS